MAVVTAGIGLLPGYGSAGWFAPVLVVLFRAGQAWRSARGRRLAFLLALPLGLVGLYIRLRIEETPGFRAVQRLAAAARTPLADTLRTARRAVAVGFGLVAAVTVTFSTFFVFPVIWRPLGASAWYATGLTVVALACVLLAPETFGRPLDTSGDWPSELRG
jgi:MFS transporter, MHS family, proline/betaine transporter